MKKGIAHQVEVALSEADVVICVLDATAELTSVDSEEIALLRQSQKPVIFFANKADSTRLELDAQDLFRLGMDHLICGSALHGRSMDALEDALVDALGQAPAEEEEEEEEESALLRVAVVGRPNAGKSSLINRLLGEERLLVDHRPGTTRDPIDTIVERGGRRFLFVDTAGLRRKASVSKSRDAVEAASVIQAIRAIERAEVVVLMCDTEAGVAEQDAKVLGLVVDRGRALVVALNKSDLVERDHLRKASEHARRPRSNPGTGGAPARRSRVDKLLRPWCRCGGTTSASHRRAQLLRDGARQAPSAHPGRQGATLLLHHPGAPAFMIVTSHPDNLHFSYQRYVVNAIRKEFGLRAPPSAYYRRRTADRRSAPLSAARCSARRHLRPLVASRIAPCPMIMANERSLPSPRPIDPTAPSGSAESAPQEPPLVEAADVAPQAPEAPGRPQTVVLDRDGESEQAADDPEAHRVVRGGERSDHVLNTTAVSGQPPC